MEYALRRADLEDLAVLADHNQAMAAETEDLILERETIENGLRSVLEDSGKGFYLVAEVDGQVVGNLMITVEWSDWRDAPLWWFQSVYVRQEFRGKGVFSRMYQWVMEEARAKGVPGLRLYVEQGNVAAHRVYERLGMMKSHYLMYEARVE